MRRQEGHLDVPVLAVQVFAHQTAAVCLQATSQMISSGRFKWALSALRNSTICSFLMRPSCSRNRQFVRVIPAMNETWFQLKWNWMTGVCPLGAQVRTRVGRSLMPDSSMKKIRRPLRWAFFERGPGAALELPHRFFVALDGTPLWLLGAQAQIAQNAPDVRRAETHAVQAFGV